MKDDYHQKYNIKKKITKEFRKDAIRINKDNYAVIRRLVQKDEFQPHWTSTTSSLHVNSNTDSRKA